MRIALHQGSNPNPPRPSIKADELVQKPFGRWPGQLPERYPRLYKKLAEPSEYSFNYDYWQDGLDTWKESFKRIYKDDYDRIVAKSGGSRGRESRPGRGALLRTTFKGNTDGRIVRGQRR